MGYGIVLKGQHNTAQGISPVYNCGEGNGIGTPKPASEVAEGHRGVVYTFPFAMYL